MTTLARSTLHTLAPAVAALVAALAVAPAAAASSPPALAEEWTALRLREALLGRESWRPIPTIADREAWAALPPAMRDLLLQRGESVLARPIAPLPASLFLEYARNGDRRRFEGEAFGRRDRLHALVLAECLEDRGRFLDAVVDTIWAIAEESSWTVPAHQGAQKAGPGLPDTAEPIVDLFSAQTAHSLAWTAYLLGDRLDRVSPLVRPRLAREVEARVLGPYLARDDFWWMGLSARSRRGRPNNWNPWINSNVLAVTLLLEPSPERRAELIHKALRSLDRFLTPYPRDGSCDEGPAYWSRAGGSLFETLELLHSATAGKADFFADPVIGEIGRFLYRARIAGDSFVNIGDAPARVAVDRGLVFRYGLRIGDPLLQALGASGATEASVADEDRSLGRMLFAIFGWEAIAAQREQPAPLVRDVWLPSEDMQLMAARDREGTAEGFYVAAWAGHNDQSHNHNDVGNVIVHLDGVPVFVDLGRVTYTAATFGPKRYEIPAMQSAYHNLPTVSGAMQSAGRAFAARQVVYAASAGAAELRMDIAAAYPGAAGVRSWLRTVRLNRGRDVLVTDRFALAQPSSDVRLSLMTPCAAAEERPGVLRLECGRGGGPLVARARFDGRALLASVERIPLDDTHLVAAWGDHVNRVVLSAREPVRQASWTLRVSR